MALLGACVLVGACVGVAYAVARASSRGATPPPLDGATAPTVADADAPRVVTDNPMLLRRGGGVGLSGRRAPHAGVARTLANADAR